MHLQGTEFYSSHNGDSSIASLGFVAQFDNKMQSIKPARPSRMLLIQGSHRMNPAETRNTNHNEFETHAFSFDVI